MSTALLCLVMLVALLPTQPRAVSAASTAGAVDFALQFDGSTQHVESTSAGAGRPSSATSDLSAMAWIRPSSACALTDCTIAKLDGTWAIGLTSTGVKAMVWTTGSGSAWKTASATYSVPTNAWTHVALTFDHSAQLVSLYVDGHLAGSTTATVGNLGLLDRRLTIGVTDTGDPVTSPTTRSLASDRFTGAIDELKVFGSLLSASDIASRMHNHGMGSHASPLAYYDFNEGPAASSGTGMLYNRVSGATSATNLSLVNGPRYFDIKQTSFAGTNTVITFPRSYLTAAGGWRAPTGVSTVRALLVGGGGGGGGDNGGGGGGGGVYDSATATIDVSGGATAITVGQGGPGTRWTGTVYVYGPSTGQSSVAFGLSAGGGGLGGTADDGLATIHAGTAGASKVADTTGAGGSGGGGSSEAGNASVAGGAAGSGPPNGFRGGNGLLSENGAGGGGGAGAVGTNASGAVGASGGAGAASDITGSSTMYGGGGGGGNRNGELTRSAGGSGGGGRGAAGNVGVGENGAANTGGGGGGGTWINPVVTGGNGGSGVVIVSYTSPASDEVDYSLSVNGSNQYGIASAKVLDASADFTVEAWVYDDVANQGFQYVVSQGVSNFWLGLFGASQEIFVSDWRTGVNLPVGEWVHLAVTKTGSTATLFVNGAQAAQTGSFTTPTWTISANLTVGRWLDTRNEYWDGQIDEVKVWNSVRTAAQIAAGLHTYTSPAESNLVAYYDFNEGSGSTVYNRVAGSAAASNLTLNNSPTFTDVKTTSYSGANTVVTFSRSYITAAGGWSAPAGITSLDYLVVAGGGGGGGPGTRSNWNGGGGAGGEVVTGTLSGLSSSLPVTVGVGGRGGPKNVLENATEGGNSGLGSVVSRGGGRGGSSVSSTTASSNVYTETTYRPSGTATGGGGGSQTARQNGATGSLFSGGNGFESSTATSQGGGGGAGAAANGSAATTGKGGAGGAGALSNITGTSTRYGGGGGGGTANSAGNQGAGGSGGGGAGGSASTSGSNGSPNTGGGGGGVGGATSTGNSGGNGGSGIVIVSYTRVSTSCTGTKYYSENGYAIVAFTTVTAGCTWTVPSNVTSLDYLVVAGGGGGGHRHGGGGGAGGLLTQTSVTVTAGATATIVVGAGGTGANSSGSGLTSGGNSQLTGAGISTVTAIGGGAQNATGGSGGGSNTASLFGAAGTAGQGYRGGDGRSGLSCQGIDSGWCGGGGGGAGAAGQNADEGGNNKPGNGGVGATTSLLSTTAAAALSVGEVSGGSVYFAGGGGGGAETNGIRSSGGLGGGAAGMVGPSDTLRHGTANTGGGGGGGGYLNTGGSSGGGNGGTGVVLVRYSLATTTCAPVTYTDGDYTVAEFQTTGSCTWTVPTGIAAVDVLAVGGGGGGGAWVGAGGGGGGVTETRSQVTAGATVTVVVGAGGTPSSANTDGTVTAGSNGGASSFAAVTAAGGGRGATWDRFAAGSGASVATGGGGSQQSGTYSRGTGSASTPNRLGGNANSNAQPHATGGGAGAGGDGEAGTASRSGAGGIGVSSSITGAAIHYGGGGGGSGHGVWPDAFTMSSTFPSGAGGIGGGGAGGGPAAVSDSVYGGDGADGLGGGGGGAGTYWGVAAYRYSEGGEGGDGVVIVRYPTVPCVPTQNTVGAHVVLTFSSLGECLWVVPDGVSTVDYLVVGGGGGGAAYQDTSGNSSNGGGGGAGGVIDGSGLSLTPTQGVSVTVGAGGDGGAVSTTTGDPGDPGGDSVVGGAGITTITAVGGGFGAGSTARYAGGDGGSGGGALGSAVTSANGGTGVVGPPRQGYDGGANNAGCGNRRPAGGGGGASAAGGAGTCVNSVNHQSGAGGAGRAVSITGSSVVYGGGGGGGGYGYSSGGSNPGTGGAGGGGAGGGRTGSPGTDGRGGGGGGAGFAPATSVSVTGGRGGHGVVVLRYLNRIVSKVAGDGQTGVGNSAASVNPKVRVVDAAGNGVDGVTVTFTAGANSGSVGSASVTTSGGGYAETTWTFGTGTTQTVTATMSLAGSTTETFTATVTTSLAVTYDANGGTGAPVQSTQNVGSTVTVSSTTPTRTGYTFSSWNTAANGSGTQYAPGATFTMPSNAVSLYAQWTVNSHNVIYDANGGSGAPSTSSSTYGSTVTLSATRPTRSGYSFTGWNTAANGSGTSYAWNGSAFSPASFTLGDANVTLFAQWTVNSYTVSYDANGGSGAPSSQSANYSTSVTVSSTVPTRTGYSFSGWNTAANGSGTSAASGSSFTLGDANVTLFAQWTVNSYTVSYDANGGSGAPSSVSANYGSTVTLSATRPTRVGHSFTGWNTAANGSGTSYTWSGSAFSPASFTLSDANVTLFARWTVNSYTVSYDANGGSGAPSSQSANYNTSVTVSSTAPTRTGYSFSGWNTAANGSGSDYSAGTSLTVTENVTLFAKWTVQTFSISYNANGGTGAPSTATGIAFGSSTTISATVPTRSGYTFAGWNTAANGSGVSYASSASLTMPANNLSLFAQWTATTQTVSYDANGGSGAPSSVSAATDATVTVSSSAPTRTGYTFQRWNTAANGSGLDYSSGATFTMGASNVTLYAVWLANTYSVTYDANGGMSPPASSTAQTDATVTVSATVPTRAGYTFMSWNTARNGGGTHYASSATFTMPAQAVTLFAIWSPNANNLVYNANGGSGAPATSVATTDSTATVSSTVPTRSGYTFTGWNTAVNGSGMSYASGASFTMPTTHLTLYAQWTAATYQVVYDANGGTGAPSATSGAYFSVVTLSSTAPTRTGYTFTGWGTLADGSGNNYAAGGTFTVPAQNTTMYAVWVADVNDVYYVVNGGVGGPTAITAATGTTVTLTSTLPTRTGYSFTGWNTAVNGSGTSYAWNGSVFAQSTFTMPGSDVFLYAQWTLNSYNVVYDVNGGAGGSPSTQTAQFGASVALAAAVTRTGYTFAGWNTAANGSGAQFAAGASYTVGPSDVTLYAEWDRNVNALIFDALGGFSAPNVRFGATGATLTLPATVPVREGYTFVHWEDSNQTQHSPGDTFVMPVSSVTLFAQWSINSYQLTYDLNGGSGTVPTLQTVVFASPVTVAATSPTRSGFTFDGWNTAVNGSGTALGAGASFTMPARSVTLFAQWDEVPPAPTTIAPVPVPTTTVPTTTIPSATRSTTQSVAAAPTSTTPSRQNTSSASPTTNPTSTTSPTVPSPTTPPPVDSPEVDATDDMSTTGGTFTWLRLMIAGLVILLLIWTVARSTRRRN